MKDVLDHLWGTAESLGPEQRRAEREFSWELHVKGKVDKVAEMVRSVRETKLECLEHSGKRTVCNGYSCWVSLLLVAVKLCGTLGLSV